MTCDEQCTVELTTPIAIRVVRWDETMNILGIGLLILKFQAVKWMREESSKGMVHPTKTFPFCANIHFYSGTSAPWETFLPSEPRFFSVPARKRMEKLTRTLMVIQ